jgi:hypothetical protein
MKKMNEPKLHHWLPQFLMRPWCDSDGLLISFYRPRDKVIWKKRSPKSLGGSNELYTIHWGKIENKKQIETNVFARTLDDPAAKVRDRLLSGELDILTREERVVFSQFLLSLLLRRPDNLVERRKEHEQGWLEDMARIPLKVDGGQRLPTSEELAVIRRGWAGYGSDLVLRTMLEAIGDPGNWEQICSLDWKVVDMSKSRFDMVFGDRPIEKLWPRNDLRYLLLPISPDSVFVAASKRAYLNELNDPDEFREVFALRVVGNQFRRAEKFVVSRNLGPNDGFLRIAERCLGREEDCSDSS